MIGQNLRQFRIEQKIGSGAMGEVFRAIDERTGRVAAVKVITGEAVGQSTNANERFIREAEILQKFRHPNIVRFLGGGKYRGTLYIAMEFVQGETLDRVLGRREFLPWREVVELGIQLCDALDYAHAKGVVHRDLKPSNLMLTEQGQLKLTDFGIAKDLDATTALTATGRTLGTAAYMAPEQITGSTSISHKTDLYALGCVLYQMLTGRTPFLGKTAVVMMQGHLTDPPPRASSKNPDVPKELDNLILDLMSKGPSDRPLDAAAVAYRLRTLQAKDRRGEPIAMVFGPKLNATPAADATVPLSQVPTTAVERRQPPPAARRRLEDLLSDRRVGTALLVALLLAALAIGIYLFIVITWPSQETLFRKAKALMEEKDSASWARAKQEYIDPLDLRFPDHPYRAQTREWLDRILLHRAKERAQKFGIIGPRDPTEARYQVFAARVLDAQKLGREDQVAILWREFAAELRGQENDPEVHKWALLALDRARESEAQLKGIRQERLNAATRRLEMADASLKQGRVDEAHRYLRDLLDEFGPAAASDPALARLLQQASDRLPENRPGPSSPTPAPGPASGPTSTPAPGSTSP